jgi:N-acetylneuraminic acid mutarotase
MSGPRFGAAATLLHDGRVLVAGGYSDAGGSKLIRTAEIYDPVSGSWTATAPMADGIGDGTAITLHDGRVLLVGDTAAEIYNPVADSWRRTAPFVDSKEGLTDHAAALLGDGRVLVVGGYDPAAETFDPATGQWTHVDTLTNHGMGATAVSLRDGRVLVVGGTHIHGHVGGSESVDSTAAELLSPTDLSWMRVASTLYDQKYAASAVLPSGQVLVASGRYGNGPGAITSAELFDPSTGQWSSTSDVPDGVHGGSALTLPDGRVFLNAPPPELYDPSTGTWAFAPNMLQPRYGSVSVLLPNGSVLVAGGTLATDGAPTSTAELYQP